MMSPVTCTVHFKGQYLGGNIHLDHEVLSGRGPEQEVEEAAGEPQRLVAARGNQDEAAGRNDASDPEHGTLERFVLCPPGKLPSREHLKPKQNVQLCSVTV